MYVMDEVGVIPYSSRCSIFLLSIIAHTLDIMTLLLVVISGLKESGIPLTWIVE